jgi:hypothetical protein
MTIQVTGELDRKQTDNFDLAIKDAVRVAVQAAQASQDAQPPHVPPRRARPDRTDGAP